jgi:DNA-binding transcriptional regulator LsrR (DeoR family)
MGGDWRSKLTAEQVIDIHLQARSGQWWQREIAERFGITQSEVSLLLHRRRWRELFYNNEGNPMSEDELKAELEALKKRQGELEAKLAEG